jgi:hypothetical protein
MHSPIYLRFRKLIDGRQGARREVSLLEERQKPARKQGPRLPTCALPDGRATAPLVSRNGQAGSVRSRQSICALPDGRASDNSPLFVEITTVTDSETAAECAEITAARGEIGAERAEIDAAGEEIAAECQEFNAEWREDAAQGLETDARADEIHGDGREIDADHAAKTIHYSELIDHAASLPQFASSIKAAYSQCGCPARLT